MLFVLTLVTMHVTAEKNEFGVYKTKDDFFNNKITVLGTMIPSDNYNVGLLLIEHKDNFVIKVNCIHEKYWGFKYIDGNDYVFIDGIYARIVILGRINLLISPKAGFKKDENDKYSFSAAPNGSLNYYFTKNLNGEKSDPFEKLIADDKTMLKEYQKDKDNYGEFINKEIIYLNKYNSIRPKTKNAPAKK